MDKVNLAEKFSLFADHWSPKIVGELNDSYVKVVKLKGEFVWHQHEKEDEMFLVVKGKLLIRLRDRDLWLQEGEFVIIPKGVEHLPVAEEEAHVLLLEPKTTLNT
ncbi:MAG: cupin domain-containing protein, partial [Candidatus Acidiferrales bacterium]